ncbi:MAG: tetratricopeptide repeat protein [Desulfobacterium sp.]|nr:tetratricopeptide repeat protein [Desulfobacterium sp.]
MNFVSIVKTRPVQIFIILFFTVGVYSNSITNEFTNWDDDQLILENLSIRSLDIDNLKKIFTPVKGHTFQPVRDLSYALDYALWELNPYGYHLHSIFLHWAAALLLFLTLLRIIPNLIRIDENMPQKGGISTGAVVYISLMTTLLFVVHPVNVEAVSWLSGRKYTLVGFFSFLSFYLFTGSEKKGWTGALFRAGSFLSVVLAIFSSPFGLMIPFLFLLYDLCRVRKEEGLYFVFKARVAVYAPYLAALAVSGMLFWGSLLGGGAGGAVSAHPFGRPVYTFYTMLRVLFDYARNLILPLWLNNRYIDFISNTLYEGKVIASLICGLLIFFFLWRSYKKGERIYLFCAGWFVLTFLPASNIIPVSIKMADRYIYIASVGLFLFFSYALYRFCVASPLGKKSRALKYGLLFVPVLILLFLSVISINRNMVWENSIALWENSLAHGSRNLVAHKNLGKAYAEAGNFQKAITHYKYGLSINPDMSTLHSNLGKVYTSLGRNGDALVSYFRSLELTPMASDVHNNLGNIFLGMKQFEKATFHLEKAASLDPGSAEAFNNLSLLYTQYGDVEKALVCGKKAVALNPDLAAAYNNLGKVYAVMGKYNKALDNFRHCLDLDPGLAKAHNNTGTVLAILGRYDDAKTHFKKALEIEPDYIDALNNLGNLYLLEKKYKKGAACFRDLLSVSPDNIHALSRLSWVLSVYGDDSIPNGKTALSLVRRAVELSGKKDPRLLDIMAAAYAALGNFEKASNIASRAVEIAKLQGRKGLIADIKKRRNLYVKGKPYIEN